MAIAIDLGTTTIAASLLDIESGERLAHTGGLNPQRVFGADVISRLAAAQASTANRNRLTALINGTLAEFVEDLINMAAVDMGQLRGVAIAGNPAMEHLLLGLPVDSLAAPPYRPLFTAGRVVATGELGWALNLPAYIFPLPGGFVGGDLVAFLYGQSMHRPSASPSAVRLFLDLGTNGEIALAFGEKLFATSAAAGPAFEGGNLACGMAALPGAINDVSISDDDIRIVTIADLLPKGICGSGVLAAIVGLLHAGVVDATGTILPKEVIASNLANRIQEDSSGRRITLYRDAKQEIFISQDDIRQVQLAKAAIRAGIEVIGERAGVEEGGMDELIVTGSFGANLVPEQLEAIGMVSTHMLHNPSFVEDGVLYGVEQALLVHEGLVEVERLADSIKVVPLSGTPSFERHFLEQMNFPHWNNH